MLMGLESGMMWGRAPVIKLHESHCAAYIDSDHCRCHFFQGRHVLYQMMIPWLEKLMRKAGNTILHKQVQRQSIVF